MSQSNPEIPSPTPIELAELGPTEQSGTGSEQASTAAAADPELAATLAPAELPPSAATSEPDAPTTSAPGPSPNDETARPEELPAATRLVATALRLFFIGTSLGAAAGLMYAPDLASHVASNTAPKPFRDALLAAMAGGGVLTLLPGVVYYVIALVRRRAVGALSSVERIARALSPLLLAFLLPLLFDWRVFRAHELVFVVVATLFGLGLERAFRTSYSALGFAWLDRLGDRIGARAPRTRRLTPTVLALCLAGFFCVYFSYYTVLQHLRLGTFSWDMAIFDNMMWNLIRGSWFKASPVLGRTGSHIQYHATFIAYLFAPFYALYQHSESLLIMQATLAGLGALPIYLLTKRRLGGWAGVAVTYAYVVHAPLHGPIFYDFHFITTAPFWVGWVLYSFEAERKGWLVFTFICALLVREEISATLSMAALLYLMMGRRPRWAIAGGILAAFYFVAVKFVVMPLHRGAGPDKQTFAWIFAGLIAPGESGLVGVVRTVLTNPVFTLASLLDTDKLIYVLKTFGPLLLLPLRGRLTWILFLPCAIFTLLSTGYKPLIQTYFQYTSTYTSYLFFAAVLAMTQLGGEGMTGRVRKAAALSALFVTATVFSFNQGAIFQHNSFVGGFTQVSFTRTDADKARLKNLNELIAMIPPRASVAATEMEASHVSNRPDCFTMRFGADRADYLLVNLDEVSWGDSRTNMLAAINTGRYGFVATRGRFALWSTKAGPEKDEEGAQLLRISKPKRRR